MAKLWGLCSFKFLRERKGTVARRSLPPCSVTFEKSPTPREANTQLAREGLSVRSLIVKKYPHSLSPSMTAPPGPLRWLQHWNCLCWGLQLPPDRLPEVLLEEVERRITCSEVATDSQ
ncbi:hypothetical protein J6590_071773 [Homalodisca vitripennis]|nr:hypothetical protein J6590_071773 [Homalodisca vitripennis]